MPIETELIPAPIEEDVRGADSRLAIPAGARALVRELVSGKMRDISQIGLSLYSVDLGGRQYRLVGADRNPAVANILLDPARNHIKLIRPFIYPKATSRTSRCRSQLNCARAHRLDDL
ncbi:MAG: hypothetical protein ABSB15_12290 [Bryobacteraceae bacterium]